MRKTLMAMIAVTLVMLGGLAVTNWAANSAVADELPMLRLADLPKGSELLHMGSADITDISHPLSLDSKPNERLETMPEERRALYKYETARDFQAFVSGGKGVFIASFTYVYPKQQQAEEAVKVAVDDMLHGAKGSELVGRFEGHGAGRLRGQAVKFIGSEGDSVHWFVGTRNNVLVLVVANGMHEPSVEEVFQLAVQTLLERY